MPEEYSMLTAFAAAMTMVVLMPKLMERLKLPSILGYIIAGFLLGPAVTGIVKPDGPVIELFSELGKLLFMFFVGFEIDLAQFRKARNQALFFGTLTFLLPCIAGMLLGMACGYGTNASILIGSIIASHTLLAFPLIQKLGLATHPAILMVIGGTIFTDIASMVILALCVAVHTTGFSWNFLGLELLQLAIFVPVILFGAGSLARKAIIRWGDKPELRVIIMLVVIALCAEGARLIKLEGIVGAFIAGIAVKRAVRGKFVVEQLEVVAHSLFIPAFFLTTGFLVDLAVLKDTVIHQPILGIGLLVAVGGGKLLASWLSSKAFHFSKPTMWTVGSLSFPQMAATLASAVVANQTLDASGKPLLDSGFVNSVVLVIIATCVAGPMLTEKYAPGMVEPSDEETPAAS